MFIQKLRLQNYRCFTEKNFSFDKKFVLIEGKNGSGKTSILEALHYGCFLKSFRTNKIRDLAAFDQKHFFLQVDFEEKEGDFNHVQVGVSLEENTPKRLVRFNKKIIKSYRDLVSRYRIVSLSENDLLLVQGSPEVRRYFLNQFSVLFKPDFITVLKKYRQIRDQRNSFLVSTRLQGLYSNKEFEIWTKQLWEKSIEIQKERIRHLKTLEKAINKLLSKNFVKSALGVNFKYQVKNNISKSNTFEEFWTSYKEKHLESEWRMRRSLFGAHLDDFSIIFQETTPEENCDGKKVKPAVKARSFASRGQQKLILFLIKVALAQLLEESSMKVALLLDDFLTDFDYKRLEDCLSLLSKFSCQVFITCPLESIISIHYKENRDSIQVIKL